MFSFTSSSISLTVDVYVAQVYVALCSGVAGAMIKPPVPHAPKALIF